ncbi:ferritin-like fold-containing protein [Nocardia sp. NPDC127579]|uniref:ferritin-like fold-containing protein n=1 Tax=Nocardia sp. NPDC127579 TaxID=3345402 RepID=UPI003638ABEB
MGEHSGTVVGGADGVGGLGSGTPGLSTESTGGPIAADHPGVTDLFAVLAYGEISAFYRLAEEAKLSPTLRGRVAVAKMAASEMRHFQTLEAALADRGADVFDAMAPFVRALDAYHDSTDPSTWLESMVKFYVGDGIAADFYTEIAGALTPEVAAVVRDVLAETSHSEFVVEEVRRAVETSRAERDRLTLWGRRLLGEAITQAQYVMAQRDELTDLVLGSAGDLNGIATLFERMQDSHAKRMAVLGL